MTNVVKSVSINGQVVPFGGGGGSEGAEVVYLTQAEYDALPASKLTDGKIYKIKTSGVAPTPGGGDSFSYEDPTCYAGEEIHENDLIVTNGNSFNPDRTDESTDVGGTTVNKYAIGFVGNGETGDLSCKFSIIEGSEPDSVTINVETDDNGKPSGTVIKTNTSINTLKDNISTTSYSTNTVDESFVQQYDGKYEFHSNDLTATFSNGILTISNGVTMDFTGVDGWENVSLNQIMYDDQHFLFGGKFFVYTPTKFSTEGAYIVGGKYTGSRIINMASRDGTVVCCKESGSSAPTIYCARLTTPFDLSSYSTELNTGYSTKNSSAIINQFPYLLDSGTGNILLFFAGYGDYWKQVAVEINTSNLSKGREYEGGNSTLTIHFYGCHYIDGHDCVLYSTQGQGAATYYQAKCGLSFNYNPMTKQVISSLSTTKGTKYRLTIAPVVTGSVVDSVKIYEKEGEYHSKCAVNDSNSWSNVSNKTPYINSNCIQARYARKVNSNDVLTTVPCGFSDGNFSELDNVKYTYQGLKTGFNGLISDTLYYSDGEGGITTTTGTYKVGKSVGSDSLLINIS